MVSDELYSDLAEEFIYSQVVANEHMFKEIRVGRITAVSYTHLTLPTIYSV